VNKFIKVLQYIALFLLLLITNSCTKADTQIPKQNKVVLGIDKLIKSNFEPIRGKKVGLFTNFSGRTNEGLLSAEILANSNIIALEYIFTPEHGFFGESHAGEKVENAEVFGVQVISLYGSSRRPDIEILKKLDVILIDIQDIGIRSYTFLSSVNYMLTACAEAGIPAIILDRPNPIGGNIVDGSVTEKGAETFMSLIPVSYIHGLTIGEISIMMNKEGWLKNTRNEIVKCNLSVIKMDDWKRSMRWEDCNLLWFPTSPQIPTSEAVYGAATLGIWGELSIWNIGIGTSLPFQYIGRPDFNKEAIFREIKKFSDNSEILLQFAHFKPFYGKFAKEDCRGFILRFPKCESCNPYTTGVKTILAIRKIHPELFRIDNVAQDKQVMFKKVTVGSTLLDVVFGGKSDSEVLAVAQKGLKDFSELRKKYFLYK
jgi:uncharacterized protein YbbC (DUF1343 family)